MKANKQTRQTYREIADRFGITPAEVSKIINSFFSPILADVRKLPFDDPHKIYKKDKVEELGFVRLIPFLGRIGVSYNRYLKWRANDSKSIIQKPRKDFKPKVTQEDIEHVAAEIIAGRPAPSVKKKERTDLYDRVWLIGKKGKKLAGQVIPKDQSENKNKK